MLQVWRRVVESRLIVTSRWSIYLEGQVPEVLVTGDYVIYGRVILL